MSCRLPQAGLMDWRLPVMPYLYTFRKTFSNLQCLGMVVGYRMLLRLQDIDAAYMLGGSGDLDAGLSALLEVPDFDARSPVSAEDFIGEFAFNASPLKTACCEGRCLLCSLLLHAEASNAAG